MVMLNVLNWLLPEKDITRWLFGHFYAWVRQRVAVIHSMSAPREVAEEENIGEAEGEPSTSPMIP